jgi:hypothetical protein
VAISLLEDAEIEYFTKGYERFGGFNNIIGPVEFVVAAKDAPMARELLSHLDDAVPNELPEKEPGT